MNRPLLCVGVAACVSALACGQPAGDTQPERPMNPPTVESGVKYKIETVVENVEVPWTILWDPAGRMLFTERPGRVRVVENGTLKNEPYFTVPGVKAGRGEIGLMGMCLHPDYAKSRLVYLSFAHTDGDVRIVRYKDTGATLEEDTVILKGIPAAINHAGCRIRFGPDGKLYITTGEMFKKELAQDLTSLGGKVLRVNDDGTVPSDNPFAGGEHAGKGARGEIWSYGHRNPQGIDWDPRTGFLWLTEHGPSGERGVSPNQGGDELNLVEKGRNYGWPAISHDKAAPGMEPPVVEWTPAVAPASGMFYTGDVFPQWRNQYFTGFLGGLAGPRRPGVVRLKIEGRAVLEQEWLASEYGRIREVAQGPDGAIYFSTSNQDGRGRGAGNDDRILRMAVE